MINKAIDDGYMERAREGDVTKESFAPSSLYYASGACPRRWVLAFRGTYADNMTDVIGFQNMEVGIDRHSRLQEKLRNEKFTKFIEKELRVSDPPIHAFEDIVVEYDGDPVIVEIKTCRSESFYSKINTRKPSGYHMVQLLLYMYFENIDRGVFIYENKNDGRRLFLRVSMNDDNKAKIEEIIEWMRDVYKVFKEGKLPEIPYKQNAKICQGCIFYRSCYTLDQSGEELVSIPPMPKVFG